MLTFLHESQEISTNLATTDWWLRQSKIMARMEEAGHIKMQHVLQPLTNKENTVYAINIGNNAMLKSLSWLREIPDASLHVLNENNIPVLLFFPLEYIADQQWAAIISEIRKILPITKILLLSLSTTVTHYGTRIENIFKNITLIPSICFLSLGAEWMEYDIRRAIINEYSDNISNDNVRAKIFLCLNNVPRFSRRILMQYLYANDLLRHGVVSYNNAAPVQNFELIASLGAQFQENSENDVSELLTHCVNHHPTINLHWLERMGTTISQTDFCPSLTLDDGHKSTQDNFNTISTTDWYSSTWCSIITETEDILDSNGFRSSGPMITEKTVKPLLMMHPFVVLGNANSHKWLRDLGFRTFESSWFRLPEYYDVTDSTVTKCSYLIDSLKSQQSSSHADLALRRSHVAADLLHNKTHLLTTDWLGIQCSFIEKQLAPVV